MNIARSIALLSTSVALLLISYAYYLNTAHDYQMTQLGEFRSDQYLVDRKTGKVWGKFCASPHAEVGCNTVVWQELPVVGLNGYTQQDLTSYMEEAEKFQKDKSAK